MTSSGGPPPRATGRTRSEAAAALAAYVALFAAWELSGGRFLIFYDLWQLLPWPVLVHDLARSLLDLHAQPPFLNLLLGLALKAASATGIAPDRWLQAAQFVAGAVTVLAVARIAGRLVRHRMIRWVVLALFLVNPYLYASLHFFFYTAWETASLCLTVAAAPRFFDRPSAVGASAVLAPALLLVYTRSLFHPLWLALVAAGLVLHARAQDAGRWRATAVVAAVCLAVAVAWPVKNLLRFGFASTSSWAGYNFSRGLPVERPTVMAAFDRANWTPPSPAAIAAAERALSPEHRGRPALAILAKPDGAPNWNHVALIGASRELGRTTLGLVVRAPWLLLLRAADYYLNGYAVYEGRQVYTGEFAREIEGMPRWARAYEIVSMLPFRAYAPTRTRLTTGFALLAPVLLGGVTLRLWRQRRRWTAEDRVSGLALLCVTWVLAMVLLVDGAEGNRMRYPTQPLVLVLAGAWIDRLRGGAGTPDSR